MNQRREKERTEQGKRTLAPARKLKEERQDLLPAFGKRGLKRRSHRLAQARRRVLKPKGKKDSSTVPREVPADLGRISTLKRIQLKRQGETLRNKSLRAKQKGLEHKKGRKISIFYSNHVEVGC